MMLRCLFTHRWVKVGDNRGVHRSGPHRHGYNLYDFVCRDCGKKDLQASNFLREAAKDRRRMETQEKEVKKFAKQWEVDNPMDVIAKD